MRCCRPKEMRNPYTGQWIDVPCGECFYCYMNYQRSLVCRMLLEAQVNRPWFVTLTFEDGKYNEGGWISKKDIQRFMNSLRKNLYRVCDEYGEERPLLTYLSLGEYGSESDRPHYHLMLYGLPDFMSYNQVHDLLQQIWHKGFIKLKRPELKQMHYIAKYYVKLDPRPHEVPSFRTWSKKPALGMRYFARNPDVVQYLNIPGKPFSIMLNGSWYSLPRLYKRVLSFDKQMELRQFGEDNHGSHVIIDPVQEANDQRSRREYSDQKLYKIKRKFKPRTKIY